MAGRGRRFAEAGYEKPKPFIDLNGGPMINWVVQNLYVADPMNYYFLCQEEHLSMAKEVIGCTDPYNDIQHWFLPVSGITDGAACTVLLAEQHIDNDEELIIANSDQLVGPDDVYNAIEFFRKNNAACGVLTFWNDHPKWSYVGIADGKINRVAEKQVISNAATVGIYYFAKGKDFVWAAKEMIRKNIRTNNEFYVAPSINELIAKGDKVLPYFVNEMVGLGTPEDLAIAKERLK